MSDGPGAAESSPTPDVQVSVALSGGGHRASLWGLGALQDLADAGVNASTVSVSSVSGGSITNGYVGQQVAYRDVDGDAFEQRVTTPLLRQITTGGTLFAGWQTWAYIGVVVIVALASLVGVWFLPAPMLVRVVAAVVGLLLTMVLIGLRGRMARAAFRRTLFSPSGSSTPLHAMETGVDHVLCATDLRSGDHVYFARDLVYSYQYGTGGPADVDVASAVAASAALPGAFPPLPVSTAGMDLAYIGSQPDEPNGRGQRAMHLVDGGVYDNMGDQWGAGYRARRRRLPERYRDRSPDHLLVINASAGVDWAPRRLLDWPIVREVVALIADQGIQYDNTTAHRRSALIARFRATERQGWGLRGVYVGIDRSPFLVADRFRCDDDPGQRAKAVRRLLGDDEASRAAWDRQAAASAGEATQLSKMDPVVAAAIVRHAYVTTMCNAHIILGYPLVPVPDVDRFVVEGA